MLKWFFICFLIYSFSVVINIYLGSLLKKKGFYNTYYIKEDGISLELNVGSLKANFLISFLPLINTMVVFYNLFFTLFSGEDEIKKIREETKIDVLKPFLKKFNNLKTHYFLEEEKNKLSNNLNSFFNIL